MGRRLFLESCRIIDAPHTLCVHRRYEDEKKWLRGIKPLTRCFRVSITTIFFSGERVTDSVCRPTLEAAKCARAHAETYVAAFRENAPTERDVMALARAEPRFRAAAMP
jgi:hypothetical protein